VIPFEISKGTLKLHIVRRTSRVLAIRAKSPLEFVPLVC
jgi:hypothetical protein